jgi:hypothetical protein
VDGNGVVNWWSEEEKEDVGLKVSGQSTKYKVHKYEQDTLRILENDSKYFVNCLNRELGAQVKKTITKPGLIHLDDKMRIYHIERNDE